jgi:hypothetical protein
VSYLGDRGDIFSLAFALALFVFGGISFAGISLLAGARFSYSDADRESKRKSGLLAAIIGLGGLGVTLFWAIPKFYEAPLLNLKENPIGYSIIALLIIFLGLGVFSQGAGSSSFNAESNSALRIVGIAIVGFGVFLFAILYSSLYAW